MKNPIPCPPNGVEVLAPDIRGHWGTRCVAHHHVEAWESAAVARIAARTPEDWCPDCGTRWALTELGACVLRGQKVDPEPGEALPMCSDCWVETSPRHGRARGKESPVCR